jgi:CO/xanthine dehydrogenase Mo-binding subunit
VDEPRRQARFRNDALSKVCGSKVFARDIRAKDMPGWPQQQGHAMLLKTTKADRIYAGYDLSLLGADCSRTASSPPTT